jgi:hypothetical protein
MKSVIIINTQISRKYQPMDTTQDIYFSSKPKQLIKDQILNIQKSISQEGIEGDILRSKEGPNISIPSDSKSHGSSK